MKHQRGTGGFEFFAWLFFSMGVILQAGAIWMFVLWWATK